jgi:hypothetical protein
MIDNGRVCGDSNDPLFIASDYIYVRSNFTKVENPRYNDDDPVTYHYEFDEKKYTVDEYTRMQTKQSNSLQNQVVTLQLQLAESEEGISL